MMGDFPKKTISVFNFWLFTKVRSTQLSYIFKALFRDINIYHTKSWCIFKIPKKICFVSLPKCSLNVQLRSGQLSNSSSTSPQTTTGLETRDWSDKRGVSQLLTGTASSRCLALCSTNTSAHYFKYVQHKFTIPPDDDAHPLNIVGIMMRSQRAYRATIICSVGS